MSAPRNTSKNARNAAAPDWPDDRRRKLIDLWSAGKTGSQIAAVLGVSRSAVLGKLNRLGLLGNG